MKGVISGFFVAFSLYSAIPMPQVDWEKKTMRYALSFLPLIGLLIAGVQLVWHWVCVRLGASVLLYSIFAALIPVIISGGIHLDGLTDTCDALCSYGAREKKLAILKDPHIGAFGAMWQGIFLLAQVALFAQMYEKPALLPLAMLGFAAARALGGRTIVALPCAKDSGLAYLFAQGSEKRLVSRVLMGEFVLLCAFMFDMQLMYGAVFALLALLWMLVHRRLCIKVFGGITGDLAGFFISTTELLALAVGAFGGLVQ